MAIPTRRCPLAALLLLAAAGCATLQMAAPAELASNQAWDADLHRGFLFFGKGRLSFGPYQARTVETEWSHGDGIEPFHYEFFSGDQGPLLVRCEYIHPKTSFTVGALTMSSNDSLRRLRCSLGADGFVEVFERRSGGSLLAPMEVVGTVSMRGVMLDVASWDRTVQELLFPTFSGFVVRQGAKTIAAAQSINSPRVWMANDLLPEVRDGAAVALAAVLLHEYIQSEPLMR